MNLEEHIPKEFDTLSFLPTEDFENTEVKASVFDKPEIYQEGSSVGPSWHVLLFKAGEETLQHLELFDAILSDPRVYVSDLMECHWYGIISRRTDKSLERMQKVFDKFKEAC